MPEFGLGTYLAAPSMQIKCCDIEILSQVVHVAVTDLLPMKIQNVVPVFLGCT